MAEHYKLQQPPSVGSRAAPGGARLHSEEWALSGKKHLFLFVKTCAAGAGKYSPQCNKMLPPAAGKAGQAVAGRDRACGFPRHGGASVDSRVFASS
jgi:hypothetical protein